MSRTIGSSASGSARFAAARPRFLGAIGPSPAPRDSIKPASPALKVDALRSRWPRHLAVTRAAVLWWSAPAGDPSLDGRARPPALGRRRHGGPLTTTTPGRPVIVPWGVEARSTAAQRGRRRVEESTEESIFVRVGRRRRVRGRVGQPRSATTGPSSCDGEGTRKLRWLPPRAECAVENKVWRACARATAVGACTCGSHTSRSGSLRHFAGVGGGDRPPHARHHEVCRAKILRFRMRRQWDPDPPPRS